VAELLAEIREDLKSGGFVPQRVREKVIPKASGKFRRLGIPTTRDRVVQAAVKLVLEPIFEADFKPCSYGFRPRRRAQDAIAEIHYLASPTRNYEWVFEADIEACFDQIDHQALMGRVRVRVGDKRVLGWVTAFLRAGILTEEGTGFGVSPGDAAIPEPYAYVSPASPRAGTFWNAPFGAARPMREVGDDLLAFFAEGRTRAGSDPAS